MKQRAALLGASNKPERYAHQAFRRLRDAGHEVVLINPALADIDGTPVLPTLAEVPGPVDTLTIYLNPARAEAMAEAIAKLRPGRVIFNPGTESPRLARALDAAGIPHENACTLVLLSTNQF